MKVGGTGLAGASALDGLRTLEVVLAAYRSGREPQTEDRTADGIGSSDGISDLSH